MSAVGADSLPADSQPPASASAPAGGAGASSSSSSSSTGGPVPQAYTGFVAPGPVEAARAMEAIAADLGRRYEPIGFLGRGAFAGVWRARDTADGCDVAVKRFDGSAGRLLKNFYRELSALFRLRHPRIVGIVNLLESPAGARYLILEYCGGGSLRSAISRARRKGWPCEASRAARLGRQLAEGLAEAHRLGLIHRDLKPENILFERPDPQRGPFGGDSPVKLADFGLASALRPARDDDGVLRPLSGSPLYMAPEQFTGRFAPASDVYALGVILYELLHGDPPFMGTPGELARQHLNDVPDVDPDLPGDWRLLLGEMLDKRPETRPSAAEAGRRLAGLEARPVAGASARSPSARSSSARLAAAAAVVLAPRGNRPAPTQAEPVRDCCLGIQPFDVNTIPGPPAADGTAPAAGFVVLSAEGVFRFRPDGRPAGLVGGPSAAAPLPEAPVPSALPCPAGAPADLSAVAAVGRDLFGVCADGRLLRWREGAEPLRAESLGGPDEVADLALPRGAVPVALAGDGRLFAVLGRFRDAGWLFVRRVPNGT